MKSAKDTANLAVLIDADNVQPAIVDGLLAEIAKYGTANVKRIYGNRCSSSHTRRVRTLPTAH